MPSSRQRSLNKETDLLLLAKEKIDEQHNGDLDATEELVSQMDQLVREILLYDELESLQYFAEKLGHIWYTSSSKLHIISDYLDDVSVIEILVRNGIPRDEVTDFLETEWESGEEDGWSDGSEEVEIFF